MSKKKSKVIFFSTTTYRFPIEQSIKSKFEALSSISTIKVFAYGEGINQSNFQSSTYTLFKRPKNRFARYIKTIYITFVIMRKHFLKADIIVIQDPILAFFVLLSINFMSSKPKIVVESHGDFINTIPLEKNLKFPSFYIYILRKLANYSLNRADCLRVISSSTRKQVESFTVDKPIVEFPAWINLAKFLDTNYQPQENTVLFLGSISERKNPLLLLRSLSYLKKRREFYLKIVGPHINKKYLNSLEQYVINNDLSKYVSIEKEISQEGVINYLKSSTLLTLPSVSEGLGRVILEAQAVGCPVLISDAGGMKDLIEHEKTGFIFKSQDVNDISEKINQILSDKDIREYVSSEGKKQIRNYYNSNTFLNGYKDIFAKL